MNKKVTVSQITVVASLFLASISDSAFAQSSIPYRNNIDINLGQAIVIHGLRGRCGSLPSKKGWQRTTKLGNLYLGKIGQRKSRKCGGFTPAYEVIFKSISRGQETIKLFGDKMKIRVR